MSGNDQDDELEIDLTGFNLVDRYQSYLGLDAPDREERGDLDEEQVAPAWDDHRHLEDLYSEESLYKAGNLVADGYVTKVNDATYVVQGSQPYTVRILRSDDDTLVPWAICDCPNGVARGGRPSCYHTAAVLSLVTETDLTGRPKPVKTGRGRRS